MIDFEGCGTAIVTILLSLAAVCGFLYGLDCLFKAMEPYRTKTLCSIEFADGSAVKAGSCIVWRDDTYLACEGGRSYSIYAIKSWECKR